MVDVDYQEVLNLIASVFKVALPVGVIFGVAEWTLSFFLRCAFPTLFRRD